MNWLECAGVRSDVRYGARMLRRDRGFAAVAIVTIALAIHLAFTAFQMQPLAHRLTMKERGDRVRVQDASIVVQGSCAMRHRRAPAILFRRPFAAVRPYGRDNPKPARLRRLGTFSAGCPPVHTIDIVVADCFGGHDHT